MHYYKFNIADWTLHTAHLTAEEEGVYFRLVNFYYDTESPIPEKTQSVIRRLRLGNNSEIVGIILEEFFYLDSGFWHHKRCDSEITAYHAQADKNRTNGKRGGRPKGSKDTKPRAKKPRKTQSDNSGNPNITLTTNHKPLTNNHSLEGCAPVVTLPSNKFETEREEVAVSESDLAEFQNLYPAVDVVQEFKSMRGWLLSNKSKRKTASGMAKFVNSWLAKAQNEEGNRAKNRPTGNPTASGRKLTPAERVKARHAEIYGREPAEEPPSVGAVVSVQ